VLLIILTKLIKLNSSRWLSLSFETNSNASSLLYYFTGTNFFQNVLWFSIRKNWIKVQYEKEVKNHWLKVCKQTLFFFSGKTKMCLFSNSNRYILISKQIIYCNFSPLNSALISFTFLLTRLHNSWAFSDNNILILSFSFECMRMIKKCTRRH